MKDLEIKKVNKINFINLVFLMRKLANYLNLAPPNIIAIRRLKKDLLAHIPRYEAYIQYYKNEPVGYVILYMAYASFLAKPTLHLEDLFVLRDKRVQGFGKNLFLFSVEKAKEKKCARMEWCVLNRDRNARNFYEKFGARHLKEWAYYRLEEKEIKKITKK
ncbi:MAG: hypothetical protein KR126chlam4_00412 [Candidatus Anoxychlamydiales bacterium]|nr:hypothetical protein [Candidatus Anoxychlamydiales bacterium]NGX40590.1 hypothetical protein [Candidatus Anoxychlamydiales bacterium]HEU64280.1 GNAT family N-acetyltransferase [Chlamydiota bacterium]